MPSRLPKMLWPTQLRMLEVAQREHRREHRLHQRLAGLAVLAARHRAALLGQFQRRRERGAERRREIHVGNAKVQRRPGVQRARRDRGIALLQRRSESANAGEALVELQRRLGRGDVGDDHGIEPLALAELAQIRRDALDGLERRGDAVDLRQFDELADGRAGAEHGAGADVRGPALQVVGRPLHHVLVEHAGALVQIANRLAVAATADVVPADDELAEVDERQTPEQRRRRDEAGGIGQSAGEGGDAEGGGGRDAAEGADEPDAYTTFIHGYYFTSAASALGR